MSIKVYATKLRENETSKQLLARYEKALKTFTPDEDSVVVAIGLDPEDGPTFYDIVKRSNAEVAAWVDFDLEGKKLFSGWIGWDERKLLASIDSIGSSLGQERAETITLDAAKQTLN